MKEKCVNHPDKKALSFCHSCEKYFCAACLVEGVEFYYCNEKQCMAAKSQDEAIVSKRVEVEEKEALLTAANFKRTFFKDTFLFLLLAYPVYLFASFLIADLRLKHIGILSLLTALSCGKAFIANSVIGYGYHKLFIKTYSREKELQRNSLVISIISFFVFILSLAKIKSMDVTDNAPVILSFVVCAISLSVFNIMFSLLTRKKADDVK